MANNGQFQVRYESIDGARQVKRFATLEKAQAYAWDRVGRDATVGQFYAVSNDGIGKITAFQGCTLNDLFPTSVVEDEETKGDIDADAPDATEEVEIAEDAEAEDAHSAGYHDVQRSSICPICQEIHADHEAGHHSDQPDADCGFCATAIHDMETLEYETEVEEMPSHEGEVSPVAARTCECGCGLEVKKNRRFRQGHDMKLKSRMLKEARDAAARADVEAAEAARQNGDTWANLAAATEN